MSGPWQTIAEGHAAVAAAGLPTLDQAQRESIERALAATRGRIEGPHGAAALLRINPHTLRARMRKLGVDWSQFRPCHPDDPKGTTKDTRIKTGNGPTSLAGKSSDKTHNSAKLRFHGKDAMSGFVGVHALACLAGHARHTRHAKA